MEFRINFIIPKLIFVVTLNLICISTNGKILHNSNNIDIGYQKYYWIQKNNINLNEYTYYCNFKHGFVSVLSTNELSYVFKKNSTTLIPIGEHFINAKYFKPIPKLPLFTKINYLKGIKPELWSQNLKTFNKLSLGKLWKGIEVTLNIVNGSIEKTFTIDPEGNPKDIQIELTGINHIVLNNGLLSILKTKDCFISFSKPKAWQNINGKKVSVNIKYVLLSTSKYSFIIDSYNKSFKLYIDPVVNSTYLGGTNSDKGNSVAIDKNGDIYVAGSTNSDDFPSTLNAYSKVRTGNSDIFVSKFDGKLKTLIASTFIGGDSSDLPNDIAIDKTGNIVVVGATSSLNFPSLNNFYNGNTDGFITVLSNDLSKILYSTFLGGDSTDQIRALSFDISGNIFVTGLTFSTNFPTTINSYDNSFNGIEDIFISKYSNDLLTLVSSTFIGGNNREYANSIEIDKNDMVYIGATSFSQNYPTTLGTFSLFKGKGDIVVSSFNNNLSKLLASTYLGGSESDECSKIKLGVSGNIFVGGNTLSLNFPVSKNAIDTDYNGGTLKQDICISKLNHNLTQLLSSTYLGGNDNDLLWDIDIDLEENIYLTGWTYSNDFPVKLPLSNSSFNGGTLDVFITKIENTLREIIESVFLGGSSNELGFGLSMDSNEFAYIVGYTSSLDLKIDSNSYDKIYNGNVDAFVMKYKFVKLVNLIPDTVTICKSDVTTIIARRIGNIYNWSNGNKVNFINITSQDTGWQVCNIITIDTVWTDSTFINVLPLNGRVLNKFDTSFCEGNSIVISSTNANTSKYSWNNLDTTKSVTITLPGIFTVTSFDGIHCNYKDSFVVKKQKKMLLNLQPTMDLCEGTAFSAYNSIYSIYKWNTGANTPEVIIEKPGLYIVTASNGVCSVTDSTEITMFPKPILHLPHDTVVCFDELKFITLDAGEWKSYTWYPTGQHSRTIDATYPEYYKVVVTDSNNCEGSDTALVDAKCYYSIFIPNAFTINGDSLNDVFKVQGRNIIEFQIKIYNRIGGEVFSSNNIANGWDGTYKGQPCPLGVYFYEVVYKLRNSSKQLKIGTITLLE